MEKMVPQDYCLTIEERTTIYTFLKVGFEGPLTSEILKLWKETFSPEFINVLTDGNQELSDYFEDLKINDLDAIENREKEAYLATFDLLNETGQVPAPPWESVYVMKDQLLYGDPVYQIRDQLANFGLKFVNENSEPEDHIAIELEFMCYLNQYAWEGLQTGNQDQYVKGVYTQYWLHKEHFNHWIQSFTERILLSDTSHFYKGLANLLRDFVAEDFEYIKLLKEVLDNE